jgi:hypothetical protein
MVEKWVFGTQSMLGNVSMPRSWRWGTMAAVVRSFLILDAMVHVYSHARREVYIPDYRTERNTYVEPKLLLDEQFLPSVAGRTESKDNINFHNTISHTIP